MFILQEDKVEDQGEDKVEDKGEDKGEEKGENKREDKGEDNGEDKGEDKDEPSANTKPSEDLLQAHLARETHDSLEIFEWCLWSFCRFL